MDLTLVDILAAVAAALLLGFSKTSVVGMGILIVPMMAFVFPDKFLGVLVIMLITGDCFAIVRYRRHADWRILARLLPWVVPGFLAGFGILYVVPEEHLVRLLGWLVLAMATLSVLKNRYAGWLDQHLPTAWWFSATAGFLGGFATMVGHVAGPIMSVYLISMGLRKHGFMGTGAWYYLIVNCSKIPFYLVLGLTGGKALITGGTLLFDAVMIPLIAVGALLGMAVFKRIPQLWFNRVILGLAFLAALRLVITA